MSLCSPCRFWIQLRTEVRGISRLIPRLQRIAPVHTLPTTFSQNVIHSNAAVAFRTYPNGYFPNRPAVLEQFTIYKHRADG